MGKERDRGEHPLSAALPFPIFLNPMDAQNSKPPSPWSARFVPIARAVGIFLRPGLNAMLVPFLAILTAMIVGGLVILIAGGNPFEAYAGLFEGAFGTSKALSETTVWATPYIFAGLAVALAFKGKNNVHTAYGRSILPACLE